MELYFSAKATSHCTSSSSPTFLPSEMCVTRLICSVQGQVPSPQTLEAMHLPQFLGDVFGSRLSLLPTGFGCFQEVRTKEAPRLCAASK